MIYIYFQLTLLVLRDRLYQSLGQTVPGVQTPQCPFQKMNVQKESAVPQQQPQAVQQQPAYSQQRNQPQATQPFYQVQECTLSYNEHEQSNKYSSTGCPERFDCPSLKFSNVNIMNAIFHKNIIQSDNVDDFTLLINLIFST